MSTSEFLSLIHEFRSIIWFFVFLIVFAFVVWSLWVFAKHLEEKGGNNLHLPDNRLNDDWD